MKTVKTQSLVVHIIEEEDDVQERDLLNYDPTNPLYGHTIGYTCGLCS